MWSSLLSLKDGGWFYLSGVEYPPEDAGEGKTDLPVKDC
jgi:hypothetical protein